MRGPGRAELVGGVSELRVDRAALRDLAPAGAAAVRADPGLVELEAADHGASAIALERADDVVVGRAGHQHVASGEALAARKQRPELAAPSEDARLVVERDRPGRLARHREPSGDRARGAPRERAHRERGDDGTDGLLQPHAGLSRIAGTWRSREQPAVYHPLPR